MAGSGKSRGFGNRGPVGKKGWRAQGSHVVLETADQLEKGIGGSQTAGETRAQSPKSKLGGGGDPYMSHIWV